MTGSGVCNWLARRQAGRLVVRAFEQACGEFGIPDHPGGKCPAADCTCEALADQVEARAIEIVEQELGGPLPERS